MKAKKKTVSKRRQSNLCGVLQQDITLVFTIFMTGVFIFLVHDNYIDIERFRVPIFQKAALAAVAACVLLMAAQFLMPGTRPEAKGKMLRLSKAQYVFFLLFTASVLISFAGAAHRPEAWSGLHARYMGAYTLLLCAGTFIIIAVALRHTRLLLWVFLVSHLAEFAICILNFWGLDPLRMYSNLIESMHIGFIGTLGNKSMASGYICLTVPVGMGLYFACRDARRKAVYAVFLLTGFYTGYAISSESFLPGIALAFLALLWFGLEDKACFRHFLEVAALFFAASWIMKLTNMAALAAGCEAPFVRSLKYQRMLMTALNVHILVFGSALLALLWLSQRWIREKWLPVLRKWLFMAGILLAAVLVILLLVVNALPQPDSMETHPVLNRLILPDEFGTDRGYVWKRSLWMFRDFPLFKKLFGCGSACFYFDFYEAFGEDMMSKWANPFGDAHNEMLQYLTTLGIAGMAGYFGLILSTIHRLAGQFRLTGTGIRQKTVSGTFVTGLTVKGKESVTRSSERGKEWVTRSSERGKESVSGSAGKGNEPVPRPLTKEKASVIRAASVAGTVALAGFLGQGIVNNPSIFVTPAMFVVMGVFTALSAGDGSR